MMAVIDLILVVASFSMTICHSVVVRGQGAELRDHLFTMRAQIDRCTHAYARRPGVARRFGRKELPGSCDRGPLYRIE